MAAPPKKCGRRRAVFTEVDGRGPLDGDAGGEAFGVHRLARRRPHEIDARVAQRRDIGLEDARIAREILGQGELRRIDAKIDATTRSARRARPAPAP